MKIFFLTAGFGKRLKPFTETIAKPAIPFLNLPILAFPLHCISKIKNTSFVFNLHYKPNSIKKALSHIKKTKKSFNKKKFHFSYEKEALLGSGGGILKARPFLFSSKNFLVVNGDSLFFLFKKDILQKMIKKHIQTQALVTLLCTPFSNCVGLSKKKSFSQKGVQVSKKTKNILSFKSQSFKKKSKKEIEFLHFTGIQIFSKRIFDFIPKGKSHIFTDVLSPLLNSKDPNLKIKASITKDLFWFEIGNLNSYKEALKTCLKCLKAKNMKNQLSIKLKKELLNLFDNYNKKNLKSLNEKDVKEYLRSFDLKFDLKNEIKNASWISSKTKK